MANFYQVKLWVQVQLYVGIGNSKILNNKFKNFKKGERAVSREMEGGHIVTPEIKEGLYLGGSKWNRTDYRKKKELLLLVTIPKNIIIIMYLLSGKQYFQLCASYSSLPLNSIFCSVRTPLTQRPCMIESASGPSLYTSSPMPWKWPSCSCPRYRTPKYHNGNHPIQALPHASWVFLATES